MDGGGRAAGSGRESRLKSVARALHPRSRAAASSKLTAREKAREVIVASDPRSRALFMLERLTPRGAGAAATLLILGGSVLFGAIKGGHVAEMASALRDTRDALANSAGFRIASITINGRKQLSQDEVLAIGGITGKRSLLFLDAADVRDRLKANPWIAEATVLKLYPDKLAIDVTERSAFALWQDDKHVSVIAEDGAVLEPFVASRFMSLPLVVGKGAETHASDFLDVIARYPRLREAVKAIVFVGERRWNLRLASGLDVRLPETGVAAALDRLSRLDQDEHLLSRDIVAIDLRLPDRITIRLSNEAAQARADVLKARTRKKATDA
jgi:cell division protein FtsQ